MLKMLGEKPPVLTIILTSQRARNVSVATKIMKLISNVVVRRALYEEVIFILDVHILTQMEDYFHP